MSGNSQERRPTMKDVAKHAGVSVSTVSYVLNDNRPVAASRRARILDAMQVLNYEPNEAARGMRGRSAPTVGLVIPDLQNQFYASVAEGVESVASENDALVVLCAPEASGETNSFIRRLLLSRRLSGVIFLSGATTATRAVLDLTQLGPVVLVDEQMLGMNLPAVVSDNRRGARELAAYVLSQGHTDVHVIGGPPELWTSQQRLAGYREAFAAAGMDPDSVPVDHGTYKQDSGYDLAKRAMSGREGRIPTALLCANDLMAVGALAYARDAGIDVPGQLSVTGFDDTPLALAVTPSLTTVRQPAHELGRSAAKILFALLDAGPVSDPKEWSHLAGPDRALPVELCIRASVGPPRPREAV